MPVSGNIQPSCMSNQRSLSLLCPSCPASAALWNQLVESKWCYIYNSQPVHATPSLDAWLRVSCGEIISGQHTFCYNTDLGRCRAPPTTEIISPWHHYVHRSHRPVLAEPPRTQNTPYLLIFVEEHMGGRCSVGAALELRLKYCCRGASPRSRRLLDSPRYARVQKNSLSNLRWATGVGNALLTFRIQLITT